MDYSGDMKLKKMRKSKCELSWDTKIIFYLIRKKGNIYDLVKNSAIF
jgi:hypothetical protein